MAWSSPYWNTPTLRAVGTEITGGADEDNGIYNKDIIANIKFLKGLATGFAGVGAFKTITAVAPTSDNVDINGTSLTVVTGMEVTLTTVLANAIYLALGFFGIQIDTNQSNNSIRGGLVVDGVNQTAEAAMFDDGATDKQETIAMGWVGTLATAASHTIKGAVRETATGAGVYKLRQTLSNLIVVVLE